MKRWASRKFWSMWVVFFLMRDMRMDDMITNDQFTEFSIYLFGTYFAANIAKAGVDKWNGGS